VEDDRVYDLSSSSVEDETDWELGIGIGEEVFADMVVGMLLLLVLEATVEVTTGKVASGTTLVLVDPLLVSETAEMAEYVFTEPNAEVRGLLGLKVEVVRPIVMAEPVGTPRLCEPGTGDVLVCSAGVGYCSAAGLNGYASLSSSNCPSSNADSSSAASSLPSGCITRPARLFPTVLSISPRRREG